ncbi:conserved domain protein [Ruminococcus albus 8]|uniref:Conserved domain protein n=2 Tax=Ruminococcus albus TaxID=1264 RepID=E9S9U4_RUMAL|nr:conserved domain protein [Ruminococcus albus 8]
MLKNEMRRFVKSKAFVVFLLLFTAISALNLYSNYNHAVNDYDCYKHDYESYLSEGMTEEEIKAEIERGYTILLQDKSFFKSDLFLENPLPYYIEATQKDVNVFAPVNLLSLVIEPVISIAVIFVTFLASICVTDDIKNKTIRNHVLRYGKTKYILSKIVSTIMKNLLVVFITLILAYIAGHVIYSKLSTDITGIDLTVTDLNKSNYAVQILVLIAAVIFYSVIGVFLGIVFRKSYFCLIIVLIKSFLPFNFKYDISNVINHFMAKIYIFEGAFVHLQQTEEMSDMMHLIPVGATALMIAFMLIFFKKRSAY